MPLIDQGRDQAAAHIVDRKSDEARLSNEVGHGRLGIERIRVGRQRVCRRGDDCIGRSGLVPDARDIGRNDTSAQEQSIVKTVAADLIVAFDQIYRRTRGRRDRLQ